MKLSLYEADLNNLELMKHTNCIQISLWLYYPF